MKYSVLQAKIEELNLNDLINEQFIQKINDEFEDKDVNVITLQIAIRDKVKDSSDTNLDVITLSNRGIEDTLMHNTIVDVNTDENFEKIMNVLNDSN